MPIAHRIVSINNTIHEFDIPIIYFNFSFVSASQIEHSEKRPINHNKPLISNVHNHYDRTRAPRPKPLDLRRNASNRNTPSTNSTESNNSPNSIVSSDQHHSHNHSQVTNQ